MWKPSNVCDCDCDCDCDSERNAAAAFYLDPGREIGPANGCENGRANGRETSVWTSACATAIANATATIPTKTGHGPRSASGSSWTSSACRRPSSGPPIRWNWIP